MEVKITSLLAVFLTASFLLCFPGRTYFRYMVLYGEIMNAVVTEVAPQSVKKETGLTLLFFFFFP